MKMPTIYYTREEIDILVFKTNIQSKKDVHRVAPVMDDDERIICWNVDLEDIDKVLRIESRQLSIGQVIQLIRERGYECQELTD